MRRFAATLVAILVALGIASSGAVAAPGVEDFDLTFSTEAGTADLRAGAHTFAITTSFHLFSHQEELSGVLEGEKIEVPDGDLKDLVLGQMPGLVGNPTAAPTCPGAVFFGEGHKCPPTTQIGTAKVEIGDIDGPGGRQVFDSPVYNLVPSPGVAQKIGIVAAVVPATVNLKLNPDPPHNVIATVADIADFVPFLGSDVTLWGVPAAAAHDADRGGPVEIAEAPYLTAPRSCGDAQETSYAVDFWQNPGAFLPDGDPDVSDPAWLTGQVPTHDDLGEPQGFIACNELEFSPTISALPTTQAAQSPSGLDFSLDVEDEGLTDPHGRAASDIREAVLTLPEGMSANPSLAEGLQGCNEAQLAAESAFSEPGEGCPQASKIGTVEVQTPLLEESLGGAIFLATPNENLADDSLIALYMVIRSPARGIVVRQTLKVEPDPGTGRLKTVAKDIPQLPFSHLRVHLREGGRSPLISPPGCGPHTATATLYPWSGGLPVERTSTFQILSGPGGAPCPPGGAAPFAPGFEAGTLSNTAKSYSPYYMRFTRKDAEQDMTRFSSVLPPGVVGKIAGLGKCPDSAIAFARSRTGAHGAAEELAEPSCPASSRIGRTLAGAGVGSQLTYVPGSLYLAGPVGEDPLSVVAITPAKAGPFDAGNVVVRVGLTLNPKTAEVETDGSSSDPIPHILKGIPLNVRDLRVYADRPEFTLNATSCDPSSARAALFGSFLDPLNPADDVPVSLKVRYQAAGCAALGFKPDLQFALKGSTGRGGHPALKAVVTPRSRDANFAKATVTLPRSAFLEQAHIRTVCTRVQFAAGGGNGAGCPPGSIYGRAKAWSPLLDEPLSGPVYLRSSNHNLPDLVIALHGIVDIELSSRIDSHKGGIRSTFAQIPDAPVNRFVLEMQGGKKGLIVNSQDLCAFKSRADARLEGQNAKQHHSTPTVRAKGCRRTGRR